MELALRNFRLETLAWKLSFWGIFDWELPLGNFGLGSLALDLLPGIFRLGTSLENFRLEVYISGLAFRFQISGLDFRF